MRKTSLQQKNAKDDGNEWRTRQWWTQSQLRVAGRCRQSEVSAVSIEERAPEMSEHAKYVRNCARGRSKDLSHRSMSLCLVQGTDHLASGRTMMSAGVDVRPVILGATCHMGSAKNGTPCTRLGHVCKYKLGSPATFSHRQLSSKKLARIAR